MERHWKYQKYKDGIRNWSHTQLPTKSEPHESDPPQSVPTQSDPSKTTAYQQHFPGDFQFAVFARFPQRHETVSGALVRCHVRGTFHAGVLALFQQTFLRVVPHQQTHLVNREEQRRNQGLSVDGVKSLRGVRLQYSPRFGWTAPRPNATRFANFESPNTGRHPATTNCAPRVGRLSWPVGGRQKKSRGIVSLFDCTYISTLSVRRR